MKKIKRIIRREQLNYLGKFRITEWDDTENEVKAYTIKESDNMTVLIEYNDGIVHEVHKEYFYNEIKAKKIA